MINVAIVEDERVAADLVISYINRFEKEKGGKFKTFYFEDSVSFLANYTSSFDIIFMDIDLPELNGMEAAKKIREKDSYVTLIFVTNMSQFAVKGYEVDAFDYIVKPVSYYNFILKLQRAIDNIKKKEDKKIVISTDSGSACLMTSQIKYVEVMNHDLIFHCLDKKYTSYGSLRKVEEHLTGNSFIRCNNCYLVNLRYVTAVNGLSVVLDNETLQMSHTKKTAFLKALADYFGGKI